MLPGWLLSRSIAYAAVPFDPRSFGAPGRTLRHLRPFARPEVSVPSTAPQPVPTSPYRPYADAQWPKVHGTPGNTQESGLVGVRPDQDVTVDTLFDDRTLLTLGLYGDPSGAFWGTSSSHVFKVAEDPLSGKFQVTDAIRKPFDMVLDDVFHGIYSFVDAAGVYWTYASNLILAFASETPGDPQSGIYMKDQIRVGSEDGDRVMTLAKAFQDDTLLFATEKGRVVAWDLAAEAPKAALQLSGRVSNALAQDANGDIFLLTDQGISKIAYNPTEEPHLRLVWSEAYPTFDGFVGRPSGGGSGTSPSLMTVDGQEYVVIADGLDQQNVLVFSAASGELLGQAHVKFGGDPESYTEQSIAVKGNRFVVVQNSQSFIASRMTQVMEAWNVPEVAENLPLLSSRVRENTLLAPVFLGDANLGGFAQFEFDPSAEKFEDRVKTTWTSERSCPNAIPVVDASDGLYCVGKVDAVNPRQPSVDFGGSWAIERQNWLTGELEGTYNLGPSMNFNSVYAATQILREGLIAYGGFGGLIFVKAL